MMKSNISPAYAKEYREWIQKGMFDHLYKRDVPEFREEIKNEHSPHIASGLDTLSTLYSQRGVVALLEGADSGWADVQCGYWAKVYSLRFKIKSVVAWNRGRLEHRDTTEAVMILGLAKLFRQEADERFLKAAIAEHLPSFDVALGDIASGRKILESIFNGKRYSFAELLKDRKECCQKRDAWPRRPTEFSPFGVLDVEAMLQHPEEASFRYPEGMEFRPTPDAAVEEGMVAYHVWHG